jgi:hypothetical protein
VILHFNSLKGDKQIHVNNLLGQQVRSASSNETTAVLDLQGLEKGVYLVSVVSDNGKTIAKKLIIE